MTILWVVCSGKGTERGEHNCIEETRTSTFHGSWTKNDIPAKKKWKLYTEKILNACVVALLLVDEHGRAMYWLTPIMFRLVKP
jgi:hypothetical protein